MIQRMNEYSHYLSAEIRAEAGRQKMSGRGLAGPIKEATGLSHETVARMLRGDRPWDVNSLSVAAKVLDLSIGDLIKRTEMVMAENKCSLPLLADSVSSQVRGLEAVSA